MPKPSDLLQGTLDLLILKTLRREPLHGWGISMRILQLSDDVLTSALTGDSWLVLSVLMALGIDYGLVASEVASILAHQHG